MRPRICSDEAHRTAFGFSPPDDRYFATRLRDGSGERGTRPADRDRVGVARRASRGRGRLRDKQRRTRGESGSWSRQPGRRFSRAEDAGSRTRRWPIPGLWDGLAHGQHQPISGGMENEADLVGKRRTATGAIGGKLGLVQLDQIFGLAARAIQAVVDPFTLGFALVSAGVRCRTSSCGTLVKWCP